VKRDGAAVCAFFLFWEYLLFGKYFCCRLREIETCLLVKKKNEERKKRKKRRSFLKRKFSRKGKKENQFFRPDSLEMAADLDNDVIRC